MNNADLIIATLKANGVTRGFGIPSGNVLPLMEAMRTGGVEFVLTAHEGSAAFAADVTGRMTGVPGFCVATLGQARPISQPAWAALFSIARR
jgi:acetolactate synthase I/II/III large subunit